MFLTPIQMHIPDGFLSPLVSIIYWILAVLVIGLALRRVTSPMQYREMDERQVPLMGVLAAAIFAGQMLNFSVTGGTSGHLLGAAIATILLGPWQAILVMTSVVSIQALLFQDGGLLALGGNLFNMAVIGVFVSYAVYTLLQRLLRGKAWGIFVAGFLAAWSSIFLAALSCALQLALSGTSRADIALLAMGSIHALIGIGEGLITAGALAFIYAARKDLLMAGEAPAAANKGILIGGGAIALLLAVLSPLASSHPDGLEWVAEQHGFLEQAQGSLYHLLPNYVMPGISNTTLATIAAAVVGVILVFGVAYGVARAEKKAAPPPQESPER